MVAIALAATVAWADDLAPVDPAPPAPTEIALLTPVAEPTQQPPPAKETQALPAARTGYVRGDLFYGFERPERDELIKLIVKSEPKLPYIGNHFLVPVSTFTEATHDAFFHDLNKRFALYIATRPECRFVLKDSKRMLEKPDDLAAREENTEGANMNQIWRRKSKAGIAFTVSDKRRIHFAVGYTLQSQMDSVSQKSADVTMKDLQGNASVLAQSQGNRFITHSELRYIFRNRADPAMQQYVTYWYQVPAQSTSDTFKVEDFAELDGQVNRKTPDIKTKWVFGEAPWTYPKWAASWDAYRPPVPFDEDDD